MTSKKKKKKKREVQKKNPKKQSSEVIFQDFIALARKKAEAQREKKLQTFLFWKNLLLNELADFVSNIRSPKRK